MRHQGTQRLETDRLILRRFVIEDADEMYANWASSDEVTKYLTWPTHTSSRVTKAVLEAWIPNYERPDYYNWGIQLKATGELIGNISVVRQNEDAAEAVLGWCMGANWWGRGIMPEAARRVIDYLFTEAGFMRITSYHDANNPKSGRVMQKIGMTYEGAHRKADKNNQGIVDAVYYAILRDEYVNNAHAAAVKMPTHCNDETCAACVVAGDTIYLAHHAGGFDKADIAHQMRATFERMRDTLRSAGAELNDMVQINLYLKDLEDFDTARNVFLEYFDKGMFPARMTLTSEFIDAECLCMMDGIAYKPRLP